MATLVDCPSCSRKLRVPDDLLGTSVRCPDCGNTFQANGGRVPSGAPAAAAGGDSPAPEPAAPPGDAAASPSLGTPRSVTGSTPQRAPAPAGTEEETQRCPACHKRIPATAARCPGCGVDLGEEDSRPWERPRRHLGRMDTEPHRGVVVLVLGILGLVMGGIGLPMAIIAWVLGHNDLKKIRAGNMDPEGEGLTQAGRVCGIIGTIWQSLMLLCIVGYFVTVITLMTTMVRTMPPPRSAPAPMPGAAPTAKMVPITPAPPPVPPPGEQPPPPRSSAKQRSRGTEASTKR
jgi:predicted Zn finger-like uncharacterized protein